MNTNLDYIEEANVTMSDNFHFEKVSHELFISILNSCIHTLSNLDQVKKALFYGREMESALAYAETNIRNRDIQIHKLHGDPQAGIRLLHGIIGIATEAGELLEALKRGIEDGECDPTNVFEEVGDNQWYTAAILRVLGTNFELVQRANIAKLRKRFPNKFSEHDANHRNLDAEYAVLKDSKCEGVPDKPAGRLVIEVRDWVIIGPVGQQFLTGTVVDQPCFIGNGTIRTSKIVTYDKTNRIVETKNTSYRLVGGSAL